MKIGTRRIIWLCICSFIFEPSNKWYLKSGNKATEQCNVSKNQVYSTLFIFLFAWIHFRAHYPPLPPLWRQWIQTEEIHGMEWGQRKRWYHLTLKDLVFGGFQYCVPVHVVNLSQNQLTRVTGISPALKSMT